MISEFKDPDPTWALIVSQRHANLWIGPDLTAASAQPVSEWIAKPWRAVFIDAWTGLDRDSLPGTDIGPLKPRLYSNDAGPPRVPQNRVPIYDLSGPAGDAGSHSHDDMVGLFRRMTMLRRAPHVRWTIVVGVESTSAQSALHKAQQLSSAFRDIILVSNTATLTDELEATTDRAVIWRAGLGELCELLSSVDPDTAFLDLSIAVRSQSGITTVALEKAVDHSSPITTEFEVIPATASLQTYDPNKKLLQTFLDDPTKDWLPYAAGVPFSRTEAMRKQLLTLLKAFEKEGASASFTAWLPAEPASGATTALRQLGIGIARRGYPVLVARPIIQEIDFSRLSVFLRGASDVLAVEHISVSELPWIVLFDAEHVQLQWDVIHGMVSRLRRQGRPVVAVCVSPTDWVPTQGEYRALGHNITLGDPLPNSLSENEAELVGQHFDKFLGPTLTRSRGEWVSFLDETVRSGAQGRRSLFWLALRFWLFRVPGAGESIRTWIRSQATSVVRDDAELQAGLLETAVLARHRLVIPSQLLTPQAAREFRRFAWDRSNTLGLANVDIDFVTGLTFVHPLIAEELLRIAANDPDMLGAVNKPSCIGVRDLELHLLGRILAKPAIANPDCLGLIEKLVTTALRVDRRNTPWNYEVRDQIVDMLERVPDAVWDSSQVFNHHLALARRSLAISPPSTAWTVDAIREQFDLSENHLLDAIENVHPDDPEREESPLNLYVSLAMTLDYRSRFEENEHNPELAAEYRGKADEAFLQAQRWDADNTYVLENFARFKIRVAETVSDQHQTAHLLVDAVALLDFERRLLSAGQRDDAILSELARAYQMITDGLGIDFLESEAARGSEVALMLLVKLSLHESNEDNRDATLRSARKRLESVAPARRTWRTIVTLYDVLSEIEPLSFKGRLSLLDELDGTPEFVWPTQLRLEYGILLYQAGDYNDRKHGRKVFQDIRAGMASSSARLQVPDELRFLSDPSSDFKTPMEMQFRVKNVSSYGRNYWVIPESWGNHQVPLRPARFGGRMRAGDERDCLIQFTAYGPEAVPPTTVR